MKGEALHSCMERAIEFPEFAQQLRDMELAGWLANFNAQGRIIELSKRRHDDSAKVIQLWSGGIPVALAKAMEAYDRLIGQFDGCEHVDIEMEAWVDLSTRDAPRSCRGKVDLMITCREYKHVVVVDWKFGRVQVMAGRNRQMMTYMLGVVNDLGWRPDIMQQVIVQPFADTPYSEWLVPHAALDEHAELLRRAQGRRNDWIERVRGAEDSAAALRILDHDLRPTDGNCKWCDLKPTCPKHEQPSTQEVVDMFA